MTGVRIAVGLFVVVLIGAAVGFGALVTGANADSGRLPARASINGVQVGAMTVTDARERLRREVGDPARRPVRVSLRGKSHTISATSAGVGIDLEAAVDRAAAVARKGNVVERGWRHYRPSDREFSETAPVEVDSARVRRFVSRLASDVAEPAKNASFELKVDQVKVTQGSSGRRLGARTALASRIERAFERPGALRRVKARTVTVKPEQSTDDLWAAHPVSVTVSHSGRTVRVFKRDEMVKRYKVAIGSKQYPTPNGEFVVQSMQKDPIWNVPDSDWAGALAGQTIPGGDPKNPLVARWIGFDGAVGFHGTADAASLGQAASHGCVRMDPTDVKDLYDRVKVGTTVLVV